MTNKKQKKFHFFHFFHELINKDPPMFQGDKKSGQSLLHKPEEALKRVLLPLVPRWLETNHLTLMTLPWCGFILLFSYLARFSIHWLWGVSAMIAAQYVTDLLDGAIGRQRNTGLVKWGFYMDHFLDFLFLCAILIGYAILIPRGQRAGLFFVVALFAGFMVNSFLAFGATNRFRIAYMGFGPTEMRIAFILVNTLLIVFGASWISAALPYTLAAAAFGLFLTVYNTQRELWRADMAARHGHDALPAPPPSRHRASFAAALALGAAGVWLASLPARETTAARLASLVLLAVAAGLFAISLRDFRRFKTRRRFFLAATWIHLPYLVVGALLLAGLRAWFVLAPMGVDFPPVQPDLSEMPAGAFDIETQLLRAETPDAALWQDYRLATDALLAIEERYRGFIAIDPLAEPRGHADAFTLFFAAYTRRCVLDARMARVLLDTPSLWQALDPATRREASRLIRSVGSDAIWIRLFCGSLYLRLHRANTSADSPLPAQITAGLGELRAALPPLFWRSLRHGVRRVLE